MTRQGVIPLQGRGDELEALVTHLREVRRGRARMALVHGEPGIGKTRLLQEVGAQLERGGFTVWHGRGEQLSSLRPFGPLLDTLDLAPPEAPDPGGGPDAWRYRIQQLMLDRIERSAQSGPLLLVLDDLQWMDAATLGFLSALGSHFAGHPVGLLAAHRPVPRDPQFSEAIGGLLIEGALRVGLGPLSDDAVRSLAAMTLEAEPGPGVLGWAAGAGGNPLYVVELLRSAADTGGVSIVDGEAELAGAPLPRALSVLLDRRVSALTPDTADALNVAAVLGDRFTPRLLADVMQRPIASIMPALDEALQAAILHERESQLAFRHDLLREAVYRRMATSLREALHLDAARVLLAARAPAEIVAAHLLRAGRDPALVPFLREAAGRLATTAPAVAADLLERALMLLVPGDPASVPVAITLVRLLAWAGRPQEAAARAELVLRAGIDAASQAQLRVGLAEAMIFRGLPEAVLEQVQSAGALPQLSDRERAPLMAAAAHAYLFTGELDRIGATVREAVAAADRIGDDASACFALVALAISTRNAGRLTESLSYAEDAVRRADGGPPEARARHPRLFLAPTLMTLGRAEDADEAYLRGRAEAERLGSTWALPPFAAFRSILLRWTGRWDEASAEAEAALQLGEELAQPNVAPMAYAVLIDICARRGDLDAARAYRDAGDALLRQGITWTAQFFGWATAALAYAERQLDAAIARLIAGGLDRELLGLIVMDQGPGPEIMRMLIEAGELTRAEKLAAAADRTAHENPDVASLQAGALHCRGLLTRDSDALVEAVALLEDTPFVPALAAACEDAGLASAGSGDRDAAARLLKRAREHQVALGSVHDQARIDRHLRRLGISRRGRPAGTRPRRGWGSLTPAELRIAQLVAAGRSNPDIAEQLFISRYTVESHLKHIFAKLGIGSRAELAARAALHVE